MNDDTRLFHTIKSGDADNDDIESAATEHHRSHKYNDYSSIGKVFDVRMKGEIKCQSGELWGIVGATASGKTSLILGILGEIRPVAQGNKTASGTRNSIISTLLSAVLLRIALSLRMCCRFKM